MENDHKFGSQAAAWLAGLAIQRRKPVSPATITTFSYHVKRLVPMIGSDTSLDSINSGTLRDLVGKLIAEDLGSKTISEMLITVKQIVASAVDGNGDPLFPKTFNAKFIDAPSVSKQKRPCPTREKVEEVIKYARSHQQQLLFVVLTGSGLRVSEALAIRVRGNDQQTSWFAEESVIKVRATIWKGAELLEHTKTQSSQREVDLHPNLSAVIAEFVAKHNIQVGDFLFQDAPGVPMQPRPASNLLRKHGVQGFHGMRRFRLTLLDNSGVPRGLAMYWGGHASKDVHDVYLKSGEDLALRKTWASRIGIGFDIDKVGHPAPSPSSKPKPTSLPKPTTPTKPDPRRASIQVKRSLIKRKPQPLQGPLFSGETHDAGSDPAAHSVPKLADVATPTPTDPKFVASDDDLDASFFEQPAPSPTQEELEAELTRLEELRAILGVK